MVLLFGFASYPEALLNVMKRLPALCRCMPGQHFLLATWLESIVLEFFGGAIQGVSVEANNCNSPSFIPAFPIKSARFSVLGRVRQPFSGNSPSQKANARRLAIPMGAAFAAPQKRAWRLAQEVVFDQDGGRIQLVQSRLEKYSGLANIGHFKETRNAGFGVRSGITFLQMLSLRLGF